MNHNDNSLVEDQEKFRSDFTSICLKLGECLYTTLGGSLNSFLGSEPELKMCQCFQMFFSKSLPSAEYFK